MKTLVSAIWALFIIPMNAVSSTMAICIAIMYGYWRIEHISMGAAADAFCIMIGIPLFLSLLVIYETSFMLSREGSEGFLGSSTINIIISNLDRGFSLLSTCLMFVIFVQACFSRQLGSIFLSMTWMVLLLLQICRNMAHRKIGLWQSRSQNGE